MSENFSFGGVDTAPFAEWFQDNVSHSELEFDSGIKMVTWGGFDTTEFINVEFGHDNRFHFVFAHEGVNSIVTLFDGTNVGMYQRSVIKRNDRISIVYIPENLLSLDKMIPGT